MKHLPYLIALFLTLFISSPALSFTPPSQGTDNATDVILWYGENLTIKAHDITISGLEDALVAAGEAQAEIISASNNTIAGDFTLLFLVALVMTLVFCKSNIFLYSLGAPTGIVYGLFLASGADGNISFWVIGVVIALIGTYCLFRVLYIAFGWGKTKQ